MRTFRVTLIAALTLASVLAGFTPPARASASPGLETGVASFYGAAFHGRRTASGEVFNMRAMTAAHPTLPFGTRLKVTDLHSGRSVVVRVNDRGPFRKGRILDLSRGAARQLGMLARGLTKVRVELFRPSESHSA